MKRRKLYLLEALAILTLSALACGGQVSNAEIRHFTLTPTLTPTSTITLTPTMTLTPSATPDPATSTPTPLPVFEVTALRSLNVRVQPGEDQAVILVLDAGEDVQFTGLCDAGWAQIALPDSLAWVNARYLSGQICDD